MYPPPDFSVRWYRYRRDTGPATLMRMLVCSYQCCNGSLGCGSPVPCPLSDSGSVPMVKYSLYYAQLMHRDSYQPECVLYGWVNWNRDYGYYPTYTGYHTHPRT